MVVLLFRVVLLSWYGFLGLIGLWLQTSRADVGKRALQQEWVALPPQTVFHSPSDDDASHQVLLPSPPRNVSPLAAPTMATPTSSNTYVAIHSDGTAAAAAAGDDDYTPVQLSTTFPFERFTDTPPFSSSSSSSLRSITTGTGGGGKEE